MTRQEARQWVRDHFTAYILNADAAMDDTPPEVEAIWLDETQRIADRITPKKEAK